MQIVEEAVHQKQNPTREKGESGGHCWGMETKRRTDVFLWVDSGSGEHGKLSFVPQWLKE